MILNQSKIELDHFEAPKVAKDNSAPQCRMNERLVDDFSCKHGILIGL